MAILTKIFNYKYFWHIVIGIIVLLLINRYWRVIASKFKPIVGDFNNASLTDSRKIVLRALASKINADINGFVTNDELDSDFVALLALNDSEFYFLVNYYNGYLGDLYDDVDWEFMPFNDSDDKVLSRILSMGL